MIGTVSDESHKSLAQETVAGLPGVKSVDNKPEAYGKVEKITGKVQENNGSV